MEGDLNNVWVWFKLCRLEEYSPRESRAEALMTTLCTVTVKAADEKAR